MKRLMFFIMLVVVFGFITLVNAAPTNSELLFGLVTGSGPVCFGCGPGVMLSGSGANDLVLIDPMTGTTIIVGANLPSGIDNFVAALDPVGSKYFYQSNGSFFVVDTQTGTLLSTLPLPGNLISLDFDPPSGTLFGLVTGSGPVCFACGPGVMLSGSGANELVNIDPVTGTITIVATNLPSGIDNFVATFDPVGSQYFYQSNGSLFVVDTQTGTLLRTLPLPGNLISLDFDPLSGTLFGLVTGSGPVCIGCGPGVMLSGSGANDLVLIDPMTGTTIIVGANLPSGIDNFVAALDPAGSKYFYQSNGSLFVVDTRTGTLLRTLPANNFLSIAFSPGTSVTAGIDIKPNSLPNSINPKSKGVIPVAILTTSSFDATTVDPLSVKFGPNGATESHGKGHIEDVDSDGDLDLVLHFKTQQTGIQCGDTQASLTGKTFGDDDITGTDAIQTVGCSSSKTMAKAESEVPQEFAFLQNYPNPFNPETEIRFQLPEASHVVVKIFNLLGREMITLTDRPFEAGYHRLRWNGKDSHGNSLASGVYLYQIRAGNFSQVRKMSLLR